MLENSLPHNAAQRAPSRPRLPPAFAKSFLANNGINDENITDVTSPQFAKAMTLLKSYNINKS